MGAASLTGARLLQFSAALILFGAPLFNLYGLENTAAPSAASMRWPWQRVLLIAAAVALFGALLWVMAETAFLSEDARDAVRPTALWTVLSETHFGRACLVRIALLILSMMVLLSSAHSKARWTAQATLGAAVTASFAWTGHGAVDRGVQGLLHLGADLLHLLAAGVWIGALLPLAALVLRSSRSQVSEDARAALFGLDRFSAIGIPVVAVLVLSGIVNSWFLIGPSRWSTLFTTAYGLVLLFKLFLFAIMLVLAALNRYRAAPALRTALDASRTTQPSLRMLHTTLLTETAMAVLVLLAVSALGTLAPPISGD